MNRSPVQSSHLKSVGFEDGILEVEYASGKVYRYSGVKEDDYGTILAGESPGRGLRQAIHKEGVIGRELARELVELE